MDKGLRKKFDRAWAEPYESVKSWKDKNGGKAVGLVLTDVPEELVLAAGALPMSVLAAEVPIQHADRHFQGFACSYSRSVIELAERGDLSFLDGLIMPYICDTTRCMDLVFKFMKKFEYYDCLRIPRRDSGSGVGKYYRAELTRLGQSLAGFTGVEVTEEKLSDAIKAYNRVRSLLAQLRQALREKKGISFADYISAVRAAMVLHPEHSEPLLKEAAGAQGRAASKNGKPRVVAAGKLMEPFGLTELIEESGLEVVEDHLAVGGRWVESRASESGDPWEALVSRQTSRLPLSGIWSDRPHRASYLIERVKELHADGAVLMVQKFCEPIEIDYPGVKEEMDKQGVPLLAIETDYRKASLEPVRTRVEAFAEMLREKAR